MPPKIPKPQAGFRINVVVTALHSLRADFRGLDGSMLSAHGVLKQKIQPSYSLIAFLGAGMISALHLCKRLEA